MLHEGINAADALSFVALAATGDTINQTSSNSNADIAFSPNNSLTTALTSSNIFLPQFTTITATDTTNNMTGLAYVLTIPSLSATTVMGMQQVAPGSNITITAVSAPGISPPISNIISWRRFDENNIPGLTLPGQKISDSVTLCYAIASDQLF